MTHPRVIEAKMLRKLIVTLAALATLIAPAAFAQAGLGEDAHNLKLADSRLDGGIQQRASRSEVWEVRAANATEAQTATIEAPPAPRIHTVQAGEGLAVIAEQYGVDWRRLCDANAEVAQPNLIFSGMQLRIPEPGEQLSERPECRMPVRVVAASQGGGAHAPPVYVAGDDVWAALRRCESGGNYALNTGNGYYGAYQFSASTWNSMGAGYARADLAPPSVQDDAARRLQARSGWGQWPSCSRQLGLR